MINITRLLLEDKKKQLLKEYSEKIVKELVARYKRQQPNLLEPEIRSYINRFDQLKGSIKQRIDRGDEIVLSVVPEDISKVPQWKEKNFAIDINRYQKWKDLEKMVDVFPAPAGAVKAALAAVNDAKSDADLVYKQDGIEIHKGDAKHKCVKYGHGMGNSYSWCIARMGDGNMYDSYRFMRNDSRMFYFMFDRNRSSRQDNGRWIDPFHACVIHVFEDGRYGFTQAGNDGDKTVDSWEALSGLMPKELWNKIKGLKGMIGYQEPSEQEKVAAAIAGRDLTFEQFKSLSHENKLLVINSGKKLNDIRMIQILPTDLKSQYINMFQKMPFECVATNLPLIKRYIIQQFDRRGNAINADYLEYMTDEQKQKYFDKFHDKPALDYSHIAKYFPEYAKVLVDNFIENYIYLPDIMEPYMDDKQKLIWKTFMPAYASSQVHSFDDKIDMVKNYHFVSEPLKRDAWEKIDSATKKTFIHFVKGLITRGVLQNYDSLAGAIPDAAIQHGHLMLHFGGENELTDVEGGELNENIYNDWQQYSWLRKAGIYK